MSRKIQPLKNMKKTTQQIRPALLSRLASYRAKKAKNPQHVHAPYTSPDYSGRWGGGVWQCGENVGYRRTFTRWHECPESFARFRGLAHKLARIDHTGWYTSEDGVGSDLARGVVYLLPHGRFTAGVADPFNSDKDGHGPCIFDVDERGNLTLYDDEQEAARAADRLAELYAESEREHDARFQRERQLEEQRDDARRELESKRDDVRALLAEIRESRLSPGLCERLREQFKRERARMHSLFHDIASAKRELAELNA